MATKIITTKVDDIDGSPAEGSFTFTWQGYKYHIDLNEAHAAEMKADFEKWVAVSRRDRGAGRAPRTPRAASQDADAAGKGADKDSPAGRRGRQPAEKAGPSTSDIRTWATEKGIAVASRGRIAPAIVQQYLAENPAE